MPDSPIGPGSGRNTAPRAYKACLSCRKRKTRCDLGGRDHPPCQRCRHELRDCILPQERSSRRQPSARVQAHAGNSASHPSNNERGGRDLPSPSTVPSPRIPPQQHAGPEASVCSTLAHQRETSADLEDSIIHTTVANGNDALGLLLHQNRPAHGIAGDGPDGNASAEERNPVGTQEPFAFAGGPCDQQQAFAWATDDMKKAWSASKLGQMGWLRAHEAVSLLDS